MTERDIYRALGTQRDIRLGDWLSQSIFEYSRNIFPDSFYKELFDGIEEGERYYRERHHRIGNHRYRVPKYSLNLPFSVKKQIIDEHFYSFLPMLQYLYHVSYDSEEGMNIDRVEEYEVPMLTETIDEFMDWENQLDDLFGKPVKVTQYPHIGETNGFDLMDLLYWYSDYLFAVDTHS